VQHLVGNCFALWQGRISNCRRKLIGTVRRSRISNCMTAICAGVIVTADGGSLWSCALPHRAHVVSSGLTEVCEAGQVPCCLKAGARPRYYGAFCPLLSAGRRPSSLWRALPAWPLGQSGACHPNRVHGRLKLKGSLEIRKEFPTNSTTQWGVLQR
jgi:hypothetical protein